MPEASQEFREVLARAGAAVGAPRFTRGAVVATAVVLAVAVWRFWPASPVPEATFQEGSPLEATSSQTASGGASAEVVVHVAGAVAHPGVYRLPAGSRVVDAIAAAGGALGSAASDAVNLARVLTDGEQVYLPLSGEVPPIAGGASAGAVGQTAASGVPLDLNRASAADLVALPGIGPATAEKIVAEREKNGPFATVEDLLRVPGIGEKKLEALKEYVTVR